MTTLVLSLLLLQELLAERPAWPLDLLLCRIPGSSEDSLAPALQALCYQFKTGDRTAGRHFAMAADVCYLVIARSSLSSCSPL
jgi:hypothetical protein